MNKHDPHPPWYQPQKRTPQNQAIAKKHLEAMRRILGVQTMTPEAFKQQQGPHHACSHSLHQ